VGNAKSQPAATRVERKKLIPGCRSSRNYKLHTRRWGIIRRLCARPSAKCLINHHYMHTARGWLGAFRFCCSKQTSTRCANCCFEKPTCGLGVLFASAGAGCARWKLKSALCECGGAQKRPPAICDPERRHANLLSALYCFLSAICARYGISALWIRTRLKTIIAQATMKTHMQINFSASIARRGILLCWKSRGRTLFF